MGSKCVEQPYALVVGCKVLDQLYVLVMGCKSVDQPKVCKTSIKSKVAILNYIIIGEDHLIDDCVMSHVCSLSLRTIYSNDRLDFRKV